LITSSSSVVFLLFPIHLRHSTKQILYTTTNIRSNYPHPVKASLNMLRFHQILRANELLWLFLLLSFINLNNCY